MASTLCFTNPGTSEMHFVAALDDVPDMRAVLGLFEGVVTGAADGYGRMAGDRPPPSCTSGPGLGNGIANLHNARRARTPVVNIVGDHATYHERSTRRSSPTSTAWPGPVSRWVRSSAPSADARRPTRSTAVAGRLGPPGGVATLVVPADVTWSEAGDPPRRPGPRRSAP